jgi:hypothetical protein
VTRLGEVACSQVCIACGGKAPDGLHEVLGSEPAELAPRPNQADPMNLMISTREMIY